MGLARQGTLGLHAGTAGPGTAPTWAKWVHPTEAQPCSGLDQAKGQLNWVKTIRASKRSKARPQLMVAGMSYPAAAAESGWPELDPEQRQESLRVGAGVQAEGRARNQATWATRGKRGFSCL